MSRREDRNSPFEDAIRANEHDLLRYFQRRLINGADAAEAFGELLLTAWKVRRKMPTEPIQARMWLYAVARNVLGNVRRSIARRSHAVQRLMDEMNDVNASVPTDEASVEIRMAIESLAPDDAELVRLVYWDGFKSHEAASLLGINPSTARSRLSSAKQQLRAALSVTSLPMA
ncbi:RNA polymerase sigma factor [Luethyella okanaganae]|uniref:RNA polymerase sigma factor n=1 Tax=Luethyella okanaganae TaxID=69372 RepID=A0ABW1VAW1_9MICO